MIAWGDQVAVAESPGSLIDDYIVPPFSVLDTRQGYWQARRRRWLSMGMQSELGREVEDGHTRYRIAGITAGSLAEVAGMRKPAFAVASMSDGTVVGASGNTALASNDAGTSIFDPVLCEIAYKWWCPARGTVLDPFAGGSVRGLVAATLGHPYIGVDLSARQVAANREQAGLLLPSDPVPQWIVGDSLHLARLVEPLAADMVFTCPPYYDLEVYSDDPRDLSAAPNYAEFLSAYRRILASAVGLLLPGRFAVVVVSEIRDERGAMRGLVPDTIAALRDAGAVFYNEAVLINSAGSLPLRVGAYMRANRKLGRSHQNVIVAVKGGWDDVRGWSTDRNSPADPQLALWAG